MRFSPATSFHTSRGTFNLTACETSTGRVHLALWRGELTGTAPLVRIQSSCVTSTALGGDICDCASQMELSLDLICHEGRGIFVYLDEEGRGLGLYEKIVGMAQMNQGATTVTAYTDRGLPSDVRDYSSLSPILRNAGVTNRVRLITNNPKKVEAAERQGFKVVERVSAEIEPTSSNYAYLLTKKTELGHLLSLKRPTT